MNPDFKLWSAAIVDNTSGGNKIGNLNLYMDIAVGLKQAFEQGRSSGIIEGTQRGRDEFKRELQRQVDSLIDNKAEEHKNNSI